MSTPPFAVRRAGGDDLTGPPYYHHRLRRSSQTWHSSRQTHSPRPCSSRVAVAGNALLAADEPPHANPWRRQIAVELGDAAVVLALNSSRNVAHGLMPGLETAPAAGSPKTLDLAVAFSPTRNASR
jgi:hypothetical protein